MAANPSNLGGAEAQGEMAAQAAGLKAAGAQAQATNSAANANKTAQYQNQEQQAYGSWLANVPNEMKNQALTPQYMGFNAATSPGTETAPALAGYTPPVGVTAGAEGLRSEAQNPAAAQGPAKTTGGGALNSFLTLAENPGLAPALQSSYAPTIAGLEAPQAAPTSTPFQAPAGGLTAPGVTNWLGVPGNLFSAYAFGGEVPGRAKVQGDSDVNDTVPLNVERGTVILPRSVAEAPDAEDKAVQFVRAEHLRKFVKRGH
jgi:hypothetical protein